MSNKLPDIYLFNPTCEYAVANGNVSWQPNRMLQKMEKDLDMLPLFLASQDDIILVQKPPAGSHLDFLKKAGIQLPQFILLNDTIKGAALQDEQLGWLLPWGWSPAAHRLLSPLKPLCSEQFNRSPVSKWSPAQYHIYSKKFALEILKKILPELPPEIVMKPSLMPAVCTSQAEIENLIQRWEKLMIKAPWSSSGRGLQPITKIPVVTKVWEKILGIIKRQGYVIAEPLLVKQLDLALQFKLKNRKVSYCGVSRFFTDAKGQYQGNFLNGWPESFDQELVNFAEYLPAIIIDPLIKAIEAGLLPQLYEGYFGVDILIFRDEQGRLRVNPCLEINVRQNMGLLSIKLENLLAKGNKGLFKIFYQPGRSFLSFMEEMTIKFPLKLKGNQIESGFFPLTPPDKEILFGAYIYTGTD